MNTPSLSRRSALFAATALAIGASLPARSLARQGATDPLAGTVITPLSAGTPALVPDHQLLLLRLTMEPGVAIPPHSHPGPVALYVDQGVFGTEFYEGEGTVQPAPVDGTPVPAITMAPGDDIQMPAGDHLFYDGAVHTMRNDGDDQLVLLVAALFDPTQPGFMFMNMDMGTPGS